jgi:hypothetical protein
MAGSCDARCSFEALPTPTLFSGMPIARSHDGALPACREILRRAANDKNPRYGETTLDRGKNRSFWMPLAAVTALGLPYADAGAAEPRTVHVFAEEADAADAACGLNQTGIVSAAAYPVQQSGFKLHPKVVAGETHLLFYPVVSTVRLESADRCASNVSLLVYSYGLVLEPWRAEPRVEKILACSKFGIATTRSNSHASNVHELLEEHAKACIVEIKTENSD